MRLLIATFCSLLLLTSPLLVSASERAPQIGKSDVQQKQLKKGKKGQKKEGQKCDHSELIAFSCKRRNLCPSCDAKRALIFGEHTLPDKLTENSSPWKSSKLRF